MSAELLPDSLESTLLVVDDEESIRITLSEALKDERTRVLTAATGVQALEFLAKESIDLILLDQNLKESGENGIEVLREVKKRRPETLVIMMTAYGRIETAVEAVQAGCYQYIAKPLDIAQLRLLIKNALATLDLKQEVRFLRVARDREHSLGVVRASARMAEVLSNVEKIAHAGRTTILIRGETGVGKEVIARLIHSSTGDARGPFVEINCAAMPESLLESEVFGHEAGAFTGATAMKRGLLEMADRGTLFLDEIGEMPLSLQAKLLRVLDARTFRRVGGTNELKAQCRFVAATNRDLQEEVNAKRFREDLWYRLSVVPMVVPPLRDRKEDISILAMHFLERYNKELNGRIERISTKAMELLCNYRWPGNVRELKNLMERLVLMNPVGEILPEHLPPEIRGELSPVLTAGQEEIVFRSARVFRLDEVEKAGIERALVQLGGNKTQAALKLGISRQTLRTKITAYGIGSPDGD